jgi:DNA-binding CsgD family transcriptional regulator/PAS domain-containing protein
MSKKTTEDNRLKEFEELLAIWQSQPYVPLENEECGKPDINPNLSNFLHHYPCVTWIFEIPTLKFTFFSENAEEILGYEAKKFVERGLEFVNEILHPEDLVNTWKLIKQVWMYIISVPSVKRVHYKFNYDYRILKPGAEVARILGQNIIFRQDSKGNITHILGICNDITGWKKSEKQIASVVYSTDHTILFFTTDDYGRNLPHTILSKRELEIVRLLSQGYSSKYIADKLCISLHTVNTHRQHMIQKTGTKNTSELIRFAISCGLI